MDFSESTLTMKEGMFTKFLPTLFKNSKINIILYIYNILINNNYFFYLMCLCLIKTLASWIDLANTD